MKKLVALLAIMCVSFGANAQDQGSILLKGYAGYTFSDKVEFDYGYVDVQSAFQWGGGLEYFVQKTSSIEVKYLNMAGTMATYGPPTWPANGAGNVQLNAGDDKGSLGYLLADFTHYFDNGGKVAPYLGAGLGVGFINPPQQSNTTGFAWDLKAGAKIKTSGPVSINLEAYLQSISKAVGTDYYYTWYGPVGVNDYAATLQFGLGAVLCYDFKK